ncbi:MAG: hypothetical protein HKN94_11755 [Acidimicrobiales bacterium]|nr:hypothetical protein [Acidimicrobiales bacterium]RZV45658.1 MAG: hypothetical protein EX269_09290 [Acidimicrobiales bacterium]
MNRDEIRRINRAVISDLRLISEALRNQDVSSAAATFEFGHGCAVFLGRGLFVNRAIGVGVGQPVSEAELDDFEERSVALGYRPAIDVSEHTDPSFMGLLASRGYEATDSNTTFVRDLIELPALDPAFQIEVVNRDALDVWCEATALGWGHANPESRANSDRYARAAFAAQVPGLLLAFDSSDGRVVGCGALAIVDGVALLGGMSVLPTERSRGAQTAMIGCRLRVAAEHGADLAVTGAATGSRSERNLRRAGFEPVFTTTTHVLRST